MCWCAFLWSRPNRVSYCLWKICENLFCPAVFSGEEGFSVWTVSFFACGVLKCFSICLGKGDQTVAPYTHRWLYKAIGNYKLYKSCLG